MKHVSIWSKISNVVLHILFYRCVGHDDVVKNLIFCIFLNKTNARQCNDSFHTCIISNHRPAVKLSTKLCVCIRLVT